jgi:hypothetical protein
MKNILLFSIFFLLPQINRAQDTLSLHACRMNEFSASSWQWGNSNKA